MKMQSYLLFLLMISILGCQKPDEEVKKSVPKPPDFTESISKVREYATTIKAALDSGDKDGAHGALHSVAGPLKDLSALIDATELSATEKTEIDGAMEKLYNTFKGLDRDLFHGDENGDVKIDEVHDTINSALATLESKADALKVVE